MVANILTTPNIAAELAMCQRYYSTINIDYEFNALTIANGWGYFPIPVSPRVATGLSLSTATGTNITSATVTLAGAGSGITSNALRISSSITGNGYARYVGDDTINAEL